MLDNQLQKKTDLSLISSLINNTKDEERTVIGWKVTNGTKVTVELRIRVVRDKRKELVFTTKNKDEFSTLKNMVVGSDYLNVYFSDDVFLFQVKVKSRDFENNDVVTCYPEKVAHLERRKSLRYSRQSSNDIKVSFDINNIGVKKERRSFLRDCHDISSGGLSFYISKAEKKFFEEGKIIKNSVLSIENKKIMAHVQIVKLLDVEPNQYNMLNYRTHKVSFKFKVINDTDRDYIANYVLEKIDLEQAVS